jgi:hypothetical protein
MTIFSSAIAWVLRIVLAISFLCLSYALITGTAPFLVLLDQSGLTSLRYMLAPLMVAGAIALLIPRTNRIGIALLLLTSLGVGLVTLQRVPSWELESHFAVLVLFGPFLLWLYYLSNRTA